MPCKCKKKQAEFARVHYAKNKDKVKAAAKAWTYERRLKNRQLVKEHLESNPCIDCGESNLIVLEFDHTRDKYKAISDGINRGWGEKKMLEEIAKCEVRCANCHRIKTYHERGSTYYN